MLKGKPRYKKKRKDPDEFSYSKRLSCAGQKN